MNTKLVPAAFVAAAILSPFDALADDAGGTPQAPSATLLPVEGTLPSLAGATDWLNSPPLSAAGLRGRVVVVEFWTYSCINWRRTLPYVRAWAAKYGDQGLVVIGVHTPEFPFERIVDNVRHAAHEIDVPFPIAIDNDEAVWTAFQNQYWPALYFIDARGRIRHHRFGENGYEESEAVIQRLLAEAGSKAVPRDLVSVAARGAEVAADWNDLRSPETYVGYERADNFASPGGAARDKSHVYEIPRLRLNEWALGGDWTVGRGSAVVNQANGRLAFRFHARDLHTVLGAAHGGKSVRVRVLIDGQPPGAAHGVDVDDQGRGVVAEPRMYQLVRQEAEVTDRQLEIQFLDPGAEVFSVTFG